MGNLKTNSSGGGYILELENVVASLQAQLNQKIDPAKIGFYGYGTRFSGTGGSAYRDVNVDISKGAKYPCKGFFYTTGQGYEGSSGTFYSRIVHADTGAIRALSNNTWIDLATGERVVAGIENAGSGTYKGAWYMLSGVTYPI